ncbi:MAG: flagellar hook-length control protein FliK [Massilia sp.]
MLPRDTLAVAPPLRTSAVRAVEAAGDARQQAFQRALAGQLGKSLQGEILSRLGDGSFVVRVAGTPARMQLPAGAQVGAQVPLTLVALAPRPTFEVGGQAAPAFTEAGPPPPTGADPRAAPLSYREGSSAGAASLTPAATLLGSVLGAALKAGPGAGAVSGRLPLVGAPTADSAALAAALHDGVAKSGLFYESHVAQWAHGQRALAELAAEPQMAGPRPGQPHTDPATAQFISMQLDTQEHQRLAWQGQVWPGQPLYLEVGRGALDQDAPGGGAGDDGGAQAWQSRLRLRFGTLGELAASVVLAGGQLHIRLDAGTDASGQLLRAHADRLATALTAAGTPLASLAVHAGSAPDD